MSQENHPQLQQAQHNTLTYRRTDGGKNKVYYDTKICGVLAS